MRYICCCVFLCIAGSSVGQSFVNTADSLRRYRSVPGLVYAVFTSDMIIEMQTSGTRKFKTKDSIRINDRFHIGTNTTIFTAYIAAKMTEAGKIRWNTPLIKAIPGLQGNSMKLYHSVTLQQLLSQRAGIRPYTNMDDYKGIELLPGSVQSQRKTFAAIVLQQRPPSMSDTSKPVYSIAGTSIAAYMLESTAATEWEKLVDQYINKPLRISVKYGLPNRIDSLQPSGHWDRYGTLTAEPSNSWAKPIPAVAPASDINISLPHFIVFIQDMMKGLENKKSFLTPSSAAFLLDHKNYSMGWEEEIWNTHSIAAASGKSALFSNYVEVIRGKNIGIIVMCNTGSVNGRSVTRNFARMLREHYVK